MPHSHLKPLTVTCGIITLSDSRTQAEDTSGQLIQDLLTQAHHSVFAYLLIPDDPQQLHHHLQQWVQAPDLQVIITNGGTGIAPTDQTYHTLLGEFDSLIPGFGELFRWLSYEEIGSRAMASRAVAGMCQGKLIFSLPGSTNGVKLAMEKLILPELVHLVRQLHPHLD